MTLTTQTYDSDEKAWIIATQDGAELSVLKKGGIQLECDSRVIVKPSLRAWHEALASAATHTPLPLPVRGPDERNALIERMVQRFLGWRLPEGFAPDAGISFKRVYNENSPFGPMNHEPIGTNLFDADQAWQMVEYMLAGEAAPTPPHVEQAGEPSDQWIPVTERLPDDQTDVLTFGEADVVPGFVITTDDGPLWYDYGGTPMDYQPTHWSDYPEPPKEPKP